MHFLKLLPGFFKKRGCLPNTILDFLNPISHEVINVSEMAGQAGLEPATTGFGVRRSSQLELLTPVSVRLLPHDAECGFGKRNRISLEPVCLSFFFGFSSSCNSSAYIDRKQILRVLA